MTTPRPDVAAAGRSAARLEAFHRAAGARKRRRTRWPTGRWQKLRLRALAKHAESASSADVRRIATAVHDAAAESPGAPVGVVLHVPALMGRQSFDATGLARRLSGGISTHAVIGLDGTILCPVPHDRQAGHAGAPWNAALLGLDFASPGPVSLHDGLLYRPGTRLEGGRRVVHWQGRAYQEQPQRLPDGRLLTEADCFDWGVDRQRWPWGIRRWHCLRPAQIYAAADVIRLWREVYPGLRSGLLLRHSDIAPQSRVDPGPSVPLELLRQVVWDDSTPVQDSVLCDALGWSEERWRAYLLREWYRGGDEPGRPRP